MEMQPFIFLGLFYTSNTVHINTYSHLVIPHAPILDDRLGVARAAVVLVNAAGNVEPLGEVAGDAALARGVDAGRLARGDAVEVVGQLSGGTTSRLGVHNESLPVDVVDVVASQMVAGVLGGASTGEDTRRGDTELEEANIVRGGTEGAKQSVVSVKWPRFRNP
jgi:hypothetical protein